MCPVSDTRPPILDSTDLCNMATTNSMYCQGRQNRVQGNNVRGVIVTGNRGSQNITETAINLNDHMNSDYFKEKMLLMQAQENRVELDEEQLLFIVDLIYDEAGSAYDSDILSEAAQCVYANEHNKVVNASLTAELARYKEQVELYERRVKF
ncbi:hypothetical protein Tco_0270585 [Tanacetum coccineum]